MSKTAKEKPLSMAQKKLLRHTYYVEKNMFGRDKLFNLLKNEPGHPTKEQIGSWLKNQQVHQLHVKQKKSTVLKPVVVKEPESLYEMDMIDMGEDADDENRYILTIVDVFSRFAYALACPDKSEETILKKFKQILKKIPKITRLQSDNGAEFVNKNFKTFLQTKNIQQILTVPGKPQSNGIIERFNGTLKSLIQKDITATLDKNWSEKLQTYIDNYNNTYHETIKMSPMEAQLDTDNAFKNVEEKALKYTGRKYMDIKVNDKVRVKIFKGKLDKHSKINWSHQIFEVEKVIQPRKPYNSTKYKLVDDDHSYTRNDLQLITKVIKPPKEIRVIKDGEYEVEKIVEKKKIDGKMQYLVKWRGYSSKDNTWESYDNVKSTIAYDIFLKKNKKKNLT